MSTMQELAQKLKSVNNNISNNFLYGTIISVDPIKIKIDGYPPLQDSQILLSNNVMEKKILIDIDNVKKEIILQAALKIDDKVFIIQSNDKQIFYIAERIANDTTTKF